MSFSSVNSESVCGVGIGMTVSLSFSSLSVYVQGSRDNMSVVLVCFPGAPKINPEAVKREAELDKYLQNKVEGGASKKANK